MTARGVVVAVGLVVIVALPMAQERPRFAVRVEGVAMDVAVVSGDSVVRGLSERNFDVFDNGIRQTVTVQETTNLPLDVMVIMQPLPSLRPNAANLARREADRLQSLLRPTDRLGVVTASAPPVVEQPLRVVSEGVQALRNRGGTLDVSLWDSLFIAYQVFDRPDRRKVTLLFTNADNDEGVVGPRDVAAAAELQPAQLFVLLLDRTGPDPYQSRTVERAGQRSTTFGSVALRWGIPGALVDLVEATGGRIIDFRSDEADLASVLGYLRAEYLVTYVPSGVSSTGWHNVDVKLKGTRGTVITRPGYWAGGGAGRRE